MKDFLRAVYEEKITMSADQLHQIADQQGMNLHSHEYRVLIVSVQTEICDSLLFRQYCIDMPQLCEKFFSKNKHRAEIVPDLSGKCIILQMDQVQKQTIKYLATKLLEYLDRHGLSNTIISIGKQVSSLADITYSYRTASNALNYQSLYSGERCLFCEDMQTVLQLSTLQSMVDPNHMLLLFQQGDMERLRVTVNAYAERVRALSGNSIDGKHPTSIRRMFVELTVYVLHMASDMGVNVDELLHGVDPYNFLILDDKATPVIVDWFIELCGKIRQAIDEKAKVKERTVIQTVCDYITKHIMQCDLNLDDVSAVVHMTPSYLSKLFHREMNIGFSKYIVQQRIEISKKLLKETNLPIKEIAEKAGFASANYFGTVFKKMMHTSPNSYRTMSRNSEPQ